MSDVTLRQLRIGDVSIDLHISSRPDGTHGVDVLGGGDGLEVKRVRRCRSEGGMGLRPGSSVPALKSRGCGCPLWGADPADGAAM